MFATDGTVVGLLHCLSIYRGGVGRRHVGEPEAVMGAGYPGRVRLHVGIRKNSTVVSGG